ncbi:MAG: HAMP domain-containing protein [Chloroflexi bacterium]|nr:HAMP domain-containing protein [Chloroflexota bacterium]
MTRGKLFDRFWALVGGVSVRTKILGIVLGLVLVLGLGVTVQVRAALTRTLTLQLLEQSASVTRDLAARATDLILVNDLYALHQLITETQANNQNVRYAFILDPEGQVLAHTFGSGFPPDLLAANTVAPTEHHRTRPLNTDEGVVWDTAVPIFEGRAGIARVGLSETSVRQAVNAVTAQLLLTTVLVSAVGVAAAAFLTWILTRPILNLVQATQAVGRADLSQRLVPWADDEIGELAEAFNRMTEDLARAAQERAEREKLRGEYVKGAIAAQEEERKRIARELHDDTSQALTSLMVGLRTLTDACPSPEVQARAEELRAVASHTLEAVHDLALQLRPSVLDDMGLPAALERYVTECRRRFGLTIDLAVHGLADQRLDPTLETALYRIVQEALTNVGRHARARTVSVLLERRDGKVLAIVEDDGVGFDPASAGKAQQRLGLFGIRERAELLGGRLIIESEPGRGTSIFVEVPAR